jgi:lipopolysaccharide export system ATP-binding protein
VTVDDAAPALSARALRVVRSRKTILRDVDVHAHPGEVLGILGPSGAGKSTLFRAIAGELPVASGTVTLAGRDVSHAPLHIRARLGLGYIPQGPSVLWDLTVRQNLRTFARVVHGPGRASEADVEAAADRVGLVAQLDTRAGDLSAGERRRLEFARAITRRPHVLVCDEPFAGVDPVGAAHLGDLLLRLASSGVAVLLADHHVAEALRVCSRALLLLDGAVAVEAAPDAFAEHPLVQGRYLGNWSRSIPPPSR